jgi:hypothetical protein
VRWRVAAKCVVLFLNKIVSKSNSILDQLWILAAAATISDEYECAGANNTASLYKSMHLPAIKIIKQS